VLVDSRRAELGRDARSRVPGDGEVVKSAAEDDVHGRSSELQEP
jgi:hypothetical protein